MRTKDSRRCVEHGFLGVPRLGRGFAGLAVAALLAGFTALSTARVAHAVPSFARQTGFNCNACHTVFPQLTPLGRTFKLMGYTISAESSELPPLAVVLRGAPGFTHTRRAQAQGELRSDFGRNNNLAMNEVSLFYGGRLLGPYGKSIPENSLAQALDHVGLFGEAAWDGIEKRWSWDNVELRAAGSTSIGGQNVILGGFVNNNPAAQDPWNSTPVYRFPFSSSGLAPESIAAPLIDGGLEHQVAGVGAYGMIADHLYLELGGYSSLSRATQRKLGVDAEGQTQLDGMAPYWRVALEKNWGSHVLELGTFGLAASAFPGRDSRAGHDRRTDQALDLQYQYLSDKHDVTVAASWIHEDQVLGASRRLGRSEHRTNALEETRLTGSYMFLKTFAFDLQYFEIAGDRDAQLYADARTNRPDTDGWIFQLSWLPLNRKGGPPRWPKSNVKLSLQYTLYNRFNGARSNFDGAGRKASDNDTIYAEITAAF